MIRLDLGSGGKADPALGVGWLGVDAHHPEADVTADLWRLPFPDESVAELSSSHALEHVPRAQVMPTLREWLRVVVPGGRLTLRVPDLVDSCEQFLRDPCDRTLALIYGSQDRPGMTHQTGFIRQTLRRALVKAGWRVERFGWVHSHGGVSLEFVAVKRG